MPLAGVARRPGGLGNALGQRVLKKLKKKLKTIRPVIHNLEPFRTLGRPSDDIWVHGHLFLHVFFDSICDSYLHGFLMDLREEHSPTHSLWTRSPPVMRARDNYSMALRAYACTCVRVCLFVQQWFRGGDLFDWFATDFGIFWYKTAPREGGGGGPGGGRGCPWAVGSKNLKRFQKMKPGGTRFGALWGPSGVRRTIFGGQNGVMGAVFSHVFFDSIFDSYFHWFLIDLREGKGHVFIAFLVIMSFELFLRIVSFT